MSRTIFLNQAFVTVIIDGVPVDGFMSGDAVRITPNAEGSAVEVGLSGAVTSFSTDQSGEFEIDLMPTSPYLDEVGRIWAAQKTQAARLLDAQVLTSASEMYRLEGVSLSNPGGVATGGKTVSGRTVAFKVQKIIPPMF